MRRNADPGPRLPRHPDGGVRRREERSGDSSEGSGKPPENMCEAVAPAVPENWGLNKTSAPKSKAKTHCTLADESGKTTMVVTVQRAQVRRASTPL